MPPATPGSRGLAPAFRRRRCCLPPSQRCRLSPTRIFRGLPPRPAHPLSTLRRCPREHATQDSFPAAILILTGAGLSPAGRFRRFRFVALPLPPPGLPGAMGMNSQATQTRSSRSAGRPTGDVLPREPGVGTGCRSKRSRKVCVTVGRRCSGLLVPTPAPAWRGAPVQSPGGGLRSV